MRICILGAAGFIGTNLAINLSGENHLTLVDQSDYFFNHIKEKNLRNVVYKTTNFTHTTNYEEYVAGSDVVYHLISTNAPTTSNHEILSEINNNIDITVRILDACVKQGVKRIVFLSSGGTVYGMESSCPLTEDLPTNPICSYGVQKIAIEKILYLYHYLYNLEYRIIRLSNPYGPYQRPNGILGVVSTFTYKALRNETIDVYGDGTVIRDFIYIDDAINGIINIAQGECKEKIFNLGSGKPTSIKDVLKAVEKVLKTELKVNYLPSRNVDIPVNYLNIDRYEKNYGKLNPIPLEEGILRTAEFMKKNGIV